jgi:hypothetical protein
MRKFILFLVLMVAVQSCAPQKETLLLSNPPVAQLVAPSVEKAIVIKNKINKTVDTQRVNLTAVDSDIKQSIAYAALVKPYTDVDADGTTHYSALIRYLSSADTHIQLLTAANTTLIADEISLQTLLDASLAAAQNKDAEAAALVASAANKDAAIAEGKLKLNAALAEARVLELDLENAAAYKKGVVALVALIFLYFIFRAVVSIWSPFAKF